jgi:hypothetical protein
MRLDTFKLSVGKFERLPDFVAVVDKLITL